MIDQDEAARSTREGSRERSIERAREAGPPRRVRAGVGVMVGLLWVAYILGLGSGLGSRLVSGLGEISNVSDPGIELGDGVCD